MNAEGPSYLARMDELEKYGQGDLVQLWQSCQRGMLFVW